MGAEGAGCPAPHLPRIVTWMSRGGLTGVVKRHHTGDTRRVSSLPPGPPVRSPVNGVPVLDHRPEGRYTIALNLMATYEPRMGWSLIVHEVVSEAGATISDRTRYAGLTTHELVDVLDATTARRLRIT